MTAKPIVLLPLAEHDIDDAIRHYQREGGITLAGRLAQAVEVALRHIGRYPASGSPRYADSLGTPGLRCWPVKRFPYLVFYIERAAQVDVWRLLHKQLDIPAWMQNGEQTE